MSAAGRGLWLGQWGAGSGPRDLDARRMGAGLPELANGAPALGRGNSVHAGRERGFQGWPMRSQFRAAGRGPIWRRGSPSREAPGRTFTFSVRASPAHQDQQDPTAEREPVRVRGLVCEGPRDGGGDSGPISAGPWTRQLRGRATLTEGVLILPMLELEGSVWVEI